MIALSNPWLQSSIYPEQLAFSLNSSQFAGAKIERSRFGLELGSSKSIDLVFKSVHEDLEDQSIHGALKVLSLLYLEQKTGLELSVVFGMPLDKPFLFQRMRLENKSDKILYPKKFIFADVQAGGLIFSNQEPFKTAFYSNGWQSWSPTGTWQYGQRQNRSKLGPLSHPMLYNAGTPITKSKSAFSSDMFAALIDQDAETGLICGFLSQKEQFGSLTSTLHPEPDLQVWANCDEIELAAGESLQSDWLAWQFFDIHDPKPFSVYFQAVAQENQVRVRIKTPTGWCSWYQYFQQITPEILRQNLQAIQQHQPELPLDIFQIDDGFQQDVGSWLKFNQKFPDGLKEISQDIVKAGFTPGVWFAPFIVERHSQLTQDHPGWLLKNKMGKLVNSGFVWEKLGRALDLTHPEVQDYIREVIRTAVQEWNFPYLKLDFLYAAALPGEHYDPTKTRAQILRRGLEIIREEAGEQTILLGCGCPIGPGIGIFDMMRISADVSPDWEPQVNGIKLPFRKEPNMPSARNAIQNILTRSSMDPHLWVNDPDGLLVREDSTLSLSEVQSLATAISLTGGAVLISDDMTRLSPERRKLAAALLPVLPPNPLVRDLFTNNMPAQLSQTLQNCEGEWKVIALFNWEDHPADLILKLSDWGLEKRSSLMREFWTGEIAILDDQHTFKQVPPHGVRLLALREMADLVYLGSDLHLAQGIELKEWLVNGSNLEFKLDLGRKAEGKIFIYAQTTPVRVHQNGKPVQWQALDTNIIRIPVILDPDSRIQVHF